MKVEINVDPSEPLQVVDIGNLRAFIIDPAQYVVTPSNFPANGSLVLEKQSEL